MVSVWECSLTENKTDTLTHSLAVVRNERSRTVHDTKKFLNMLVSPLYTVTLCLFGGKASRVECVSPTVNLSYVNQIVLLEAHSWDQP